MEFVDSRFFDHFTDPRNVGIIADPDGTGMGGDPSCGDWLIVTIKVDDDIISEAYLESIDWATSIGYEL